MLKSCLIICCRGSLISVLAPELWGEKKRLQPPDPVAAARAELAENGRGVLVQQLKLFSTVQVTAALWASLGSKCQRVEKVVNSNCYNEGH